MENFGDIIGILIIVGAVAAKAVANFASGQNQKSSGNKRSESQKPEGGFSWEDWGWESSGAEDGEAKPPAAATGSSAPAATPDAAPSRGATTPPPAPAYATPSLQQENQEANGGYSWDAPKAPAAPAAYHQPYQESTGRADMSVEDLTPAGKQQDVDLSASSVADQSFQYAFPEAMKKVRRLKRGTRAPIVLKVNGRKDMRRAILLREVLMHPRAYDL